MLCSTCTHSAVACLQGSTPGRGRASLTPACTSLVAQGLLSSPLGTFEYPTAASCTELVRRFSMSLHPTCAQVTAKCHCGKVEAEKRCHQSRFSCGKLCGRRHSCGHRCPITCHDGKQSLLFHLYLKKFVVFCGVEIEVRCLAPSPLNAGAWP